VIEIACRGEADFLTFTLHNLTSHRPFQTVVLLTLHYARHTPVGFRGQGRVCQKSTLEFIPGCDEEQTDRCRDGSWDLLFVWNSGQAASAGSTRVLVLMSTLLQDFRSQDGLYNLVKQKHPDAVLKGRDLFDASLFRNPVSTSVFYSFIAGLKQAVDVASPSPTHRFIKTLDAKGRLLRSYTQNIDGLEERAGLLGSSSQEAKAPSPSKTKGKAKAKLKIKDVRNVQLHGDIHRVRCTVCSADYPCSTSYLEMFSQGVPPDCPDCTSRCKWPERIRRAVG
jgi:NAD-dependent SIR2 family protein deacetylase